MESIRYINNFDINDQKLSLFKFLVLSYQGCAGQTGSALNLECDYMAAAKKAKAKAKPAKSAAKKPAAKAKAAPKRSASAKVSAKAKRK
ncbi:MAG: hypothetical protein WD673_05485 [Alphaproteobacteria bacterium]